MSLRTDLLPVMADCRGIIDDLGFRTCRVAIVTRTWTGGRPGYPDAQAYTDSTTAITPSPRVRIVSSREISQSGGLYQDGDVRVDKITPAFSTGGYSQAQVAPSPDSEAVEVFYFVTGAITGTFALVSSSFDRALGYSVVIRRTHRSQ